MVSEHEIVSVLVLVLTLFELLLLAVMSLPGSLAMLLLVFLLLRACLVCEHESGLVSVLLLALLLLEQLPPILQTVLLL